MLQAPEPAQIGRGSGVPRAIGTRDQEDRVGAGRRHLGRSAEENGPALPEGQLPRVDDRLLPVEPVAFAKRAHGGVVHRRRRGRERVDDARERAAAVPRAEVDLKQSRAHADEAVEPTEEKVLELRVGVEQGEAHADAGPPQTAAADVVVQIEARALALELGRAAIGGNEVVREQTGGDRTDEPNVSEREEDRTSEPAGGEEASHERVLVLGVDHVRAGATRLGDEGAAQPDVEARAHEIPRRREPGADGEPAPDGKADDRGPRALFARGPAVAGRDDRHRVTPPGERLREKADGPGAPSRREGRVVLRREEDLHRTVQTT